MNVIDVDVNVHNHMRETPLHLAADLGDPQCMQALLASPTVKPNEQASRRS
ncbi:MAG: ankyrin repeat domain-containing protein [Gammaproteobacteria bacterium]|nr:ankyrin repeat domain-containing protein [Gammaproteobacteria bacterium]